MKIKIYKRQMSISMGQQYRS